MIGWFLAEVENRNIICAQVSRGQHRLCANPRNKNNSWRKTSRYSWHFHIYAISTEFDRSCDFDGLVIFAEFHIERFAILMVWRRTFPIRYTAHNATCCAIVYLHEINVVQDTAGIRYVYVQRLFQSGFVRLRCRCSPHAEPVAAFALRKHGSCLCITCVLLWESQVVLS